MPQFKSLEEIQKHLLRGDIVNSVFMDSKIQQVLAKEMQKAVHDVVYKAYNPEYYTRRGNDGGLSDTRNMQITKVEVKSAKVRVLFENLTKGQTKYLPIYGYNVDSKHGEIITDVIEDGYQNDGDWYRQGKWSESRPFVQETIKRIKANPTPLINAIKSAYRKCGFDVK